MKDEIKKPLIILAIIIGIVLFQYADFFGINLQTSEVVFYNKPITLPFTLTNFTSPNIEVFFEGVQLYEVLVKQVNQSYFNATTNETYYLIINQTINQSIGYSKSVANGVYSIKLENINSEGLLKIKVIEGNYSEIKTVEIRKPYVAIKNNIPNLVDKGKQWTIEITTFNPQDDTLEADSVDIDIIDPTNSKSTIFLDKAGNKFTKVFYYDKSGNYQFKIHARKDGYVTKEVTVITSVAKNEGIHPVIYLFLAATILWGLLFIIKQIRVRIW